MADFLTAEEFEKVRSTFDYYDNFAEGKVATKMLGTIIRSIGLLLTDAELLELIREVDPDLTGYVGFEGFAKIVGRKMREPPPEEQIKEAFRVFDPQATGCIGKEYLVNVMTTLGEALDPLEMKEMLKWVDVDEEGMIRYEEFVDKMMKIKIPKPKPKPPPPKKKR